MNKINFYSILDKISVDKYVYFLNLYKAYLKSNNYKKIMKDESLNSLEDKIYTTSDKKKISLLQKPLI